MRARHAYRRYSSYFRRRFSKTLVRTTDAYKPTPRGSRWSATDNSQISVALPDSS